MAKRYTAKQTSSAGAKRIGKIRFKASTEKTTVKRYAEHLAGKTLKGGVSSPARLDQIKGSLLYAAK